MKEKNFKDYYKYTKNIITSLRKKNFDDYFLNYHFVNATSYNKELSISTGIIITNQLLHNHNIEKSLYNLDLIYCDRIDIDPLKIIERKELYICVKSIFNTLPNDIKRIITMHVFQNKPFCQIADILNDTISNIREKYLLGLSILKSHLIYYYYEVGELYAFAPSSDPFVSA